MATITVSQGDNFQTILNAANPGDEIVLAPNLTFTGSFQLPYKAGATDYITIRSSATLPNRRIVPTDTALLPKILSSTSYNFYTEDLKAVSYWKFVGLEVGAVNRYINHLFRIHSGSDELVNECHHFIWDRCYIHGDSVLGSRRGILMDCREVIVKNSYFSNFKLNPSDPSDTQAIYGNDCSGNWLVENNYLEATGENMMISGRGQHTLKSAVAGVGTMPSNIIVRGNHMRKPLEWRDANLTIKNLFEIKAGEDILVEGNVFENAWVSAQMFAINIKVDSTNPAVSLSPRTQNITIRNNIIKNAEGGFSVQRPSGVETNAIFRNVTITNNLFQNIGGSGRQIVVNGYKVMDGVSITNNFFEPKVQAGFLILFGEVQPLLTNFTVSGNRFNYGSQGVKGSGTALGTPTFTGYAPTGSYSDNVVINAPAVVPAYPTGWTFSTQTDYQNIAVTTDLAAIEAATRHSVLGDVLAGEVVTPPPDPPPPPPPPPPPDEPPVTSGEGDTVAEIIERIKLDLNSPEYYGMIDFNDSMQDGYDEIVVATGAILKTADIALEADVVYYDILSKIPDFLAIYGIWNPQTKTWLVPVSYREFDNIRPDWETVTRGSGPYLFCPLNYRYVVFHPACSSDTGSLVMFYKAQADTLVSDSELQLPPELAEEIVSSYITMDLYEQAEEWKKANMSFKIYQQKIEQLKKWIRNRDAERPKRLGGSF